MNYETFFSDWMKRYGAPPSARDFSDDKKEQAGFRYWARKNGLALASKQKQNAESFQTFYNEYLREYGKPPRACDYGLTANEHKLFGEWAKREGLSLSKQPKSRYYIELANLVEPYKREGKSRKEAAEALGISIHKANAGFDTLADDPFDVEDDQRACEPEDVKELCDELRRRDLIPPKLLPEEWSRYLDIRQKRLNDGTYGIILPEDE